MDRQIKIVDTTLWEGIKRAGVVITSQEKIQIATMLDEIGIHYIEAGVRVRDEINKEALREICDIPLKAGIIGWNRADISDIQASIDCGVDIVGITIATSDIHIEQNKTTRDRVLESMVKAVEFASKEGMDISVKAEDASRSDMEFLIRFAAEAQKAGAKSLRFCDTKGILDPFNTYEKIKSLKDNTELDIEIQTRNDLGMATANAIAGVKAGANYVVVTVNGIGAQAGNAALEEVIMALKVIYNIDLGFKTNKFKDLSEYVALVANLEIPPQKAIVGTNTFTHESGIHADGALKNPLTYEIFNPEDVGLKRKIVIGKHSGTASIINKLESYGYQLSEVEVNEVLARVRSIAATLKRNLHDEELISIYKEILKTKELL